MTPTASVVSLDHEIERLNMLALWHDTSKSDVRWRKAAGFIQIDNSAFLDILRSLNKEMVRRSLIQMCHLDKHQAHLHADGLSESRHGIRWLHRSGSFRSATLRFALTDVERRALGRVGTESALTTDAVYLDFNFQQASRLAREALAMGSVVLPPVAPAGGYPRRDDRLLADWLQRRRRMIRAGASPGSEASRAAFHHALEVLLRAAETTYHRARAQLFTVGTVVGLGEALGVPRRCLSAEASQAASAAIRVLAERLLVPGYPGRAVAASPRVCRGPNTAGASSPPNHLRGKRIPR
ncbi:hypothetical protein [Nocardia sp. CA-135398]|uniref:hypothetical protein n=1 Tax=Nocardia sp. CA-135398 TaxID=3239977 RepID=UPI003D9972E4